uniref:J domain-containing protein n=1 Tax=Cannabis sativa TaxID=3483 RepID=A0A803Q9G9_CANSA
MKNEEEEGKERKENPWPSSSSSPNKPYEEKEGMKLWGVLLFGLVGATATTFAVGQLRRTVDWVYSQLMNRSSQSWKGGGGGKSFRSSFQEEAWKKYNRRMREEYEEEMERVERIRRMQNVFNRERNKYRRGYESWRENDSSSYHQSFQRDDWEAPNVNVSYSLSHHYSVLGLDRFRAKPYTEAEIKTAFRSKAKQFHPDQNQHNKDAAEAKFKEVMTSYEAIKNERKTM